MIVILMNAILRIIMKTAVNILMTITLSMKLIGILALMMMILLQLLFLLLLLVLELLKMTQMNKIHKRRNGKKIEDEEIRMRERRKGVRQKLKVNERKREKVDNERW